MARHRVCAQAEGPLIVDLFETALADTSTLLVEHFFNTTDRAESPVPNPDADREGLLRTEEMLAEFAERGTTETVVLLLASVVTALIRSNDNALERLANVVDKLAAEKGKA